MSTSIRLWLIAICLANSSAGAQWPAQIPAVIADGAGTETYVLVAGMVGGVAGFRRLETLLLARGARVIIIDPYQLSLDSVDVSFAAMARRVDAVLQRYGVVAARVVGHSQGAGVALRLAELSPARVAALYFLDSGGLAMNHGPTLSAALHLVPLVTRLPGGRGLVRDHFVRAVRQSSGRQDWLDAATQRAYTEPLLNSIDRVVAMAFRLEKAREPVPLTRVVAAVRVPVTVILGAAPHDADAGQEELDALAPLGTLLHLERLAGVGHFPQEEAPNELLPYLIAPIHGFADCPPAKRAGGTLAGPGQNDRAGPVS